MEKGKVYVAARWALKAEVQELHEKLKAKGFEVHGDWTQHQPIKPYEANPDLARQFSVEDIGWVIDSDVFILITDAAGTGIYVELGVAILSNLISEKPRIYVVGEHISRSMFFFHPSVNRRENIDELLKEL